MILAIDIGNSNINIGGYRGKTLAFDSRIHTDPARTENEYAVLLRQILDLYHVEEKELEGAMIASVVFPLTPILRDAVKLLCPELRVMVVGPGIKTGLNIKIDNPGQLGADLLATAVGAMEKYPLPAIIVDLGTASKITVVDQNRSFLGGSIMPGVMISLDALAKRTAALPPIDLDGPLTKLISGNTIESMRSGIVLGTASMIDGMAARYKEELGEHATVVGCGGIMKVIAP